MPLTSIIVPTWPRLDMLARCLAAVHEHTPDIDFELLVIDNGSKNRGSTWGVNRGLRAAEGDTLVILHDDAIVTPGWLPPLQLALDQDYWVVSATDPTDNNWALNPWCMAFSRASYERLGVGYSEQYIHWKQDCELPERVESLGGTFHRCGDSHVHHAREDQPTDPVRVEMMRSWHHHDYGYGPDSW